MILALKDVGKTPVEKHRSLSRSPPAREGEEENKSSIKEINLHEFSGHEEALVKKYLDADLLDKSVLLSKQAR